VSNTDEMMAKIEMDALDKAANELCAQIHATIMESGHRDNEVIIHAIAIMFGTVFAVNDRNEGELTHDINELRVRSRSSVIAASATMRHDN
jgi:hypothetical protein